jgi:peptide/nickel transport system permease protein
MRERISRAMVICEAFIVLLFLAALMAEILAPHDPIKPNLADRLQSPSPEYPFGTDHMGRCILSRIIFGARTTLLVSLTVVTLSTGIGVGVGLISGYSGGHIDDLLMRIVDGFMAFPGTLLALAIAGIFGGGLANMVIALTIVEWAGYARIVRGSVMELSGKEFIKSSLGLGIGKLNVMTRHLLPNIVSLIIVLATMSMGGVVLSISAMSFLGIGIHPPTPEWGYMINDGKMFIRTAPYIMIFPGMAIVLTAISFNVLGEGLRDLLDPRTNREVR